MKVNPRSTTQVNKPKGSKKPYAPQTPDNNSLNLGKPVAKPTTGKKKKRKPRK